MKTEEIESSEISHTVKIAFLDVGQADTIVISCPDTHEAIIVDCVDANAVLDYLEEEQITYLRGIIITHLHADHCGEVDTLLNSFHLVSGLQECEMVAFNRIVDRRNFQKLLHDADGHNEQPHLKTGLTSLKNLLDWCRRNRSKYSSYTIEPRSLPFHGTLAKSLYLLHPYEIDLDDLEARGLNNTSVVLQVLGTKSSALLTGDLEPYGWKQLQANHPELHSEVLKFPHHGAWKDEDISTILDCVKPSIVIISVGSDGYNKYSHPNPSVLKALYQKPHIRVLCTQATDQCQVAPLEKRLSVINHLKAESERGEYQYIISRKGCPCAGTIIIELGDKALVKQPKIDFHRNFIITPHFKDHKCNI
jgi:competence protein ComEC